MIELKVRTLLLVVCFALFVSSCGSETETHAESEATVTSTAATSSTVEAAPTEVEVNGELIGVVEFSPSTRTANLSRMCPVPDREFVPLDQEGLDETTAFAVFEIDGVEVERLPVVTSLLSGGSIVEGPILGFFDDSSQEDSDNVIFLPYIDGDLFIEIEGVVVSEIFSVANFSTDDCIAGTEPG